MATTPVPSFIEPKITSHQRRHLDPQVMRKINFSSNEGFSDTIQVYLRVKPDEDSRDLKIDYFKIEGNSIIIGPPNTEKQKGKYCKRRYRFSSVFGPEVEQSEIFQSVVQQMFRQFLFGQNCLLFSYGTTSSGKTHTIHGTVKDPGIVPMALELLFKAIEGKQDDNASLYPEGQNTVTLLSNTSIATNEYFKHQILSSEQAMSLKSIKSVSGSWNTLKESNYEEMRERVGTVINFSEYLQDDCMYSVWVSFAEIYNEFIYDVLEPSTPRKSLKLAYDTDKSVYVKGLRHVNVSNSWEAYRVYLFGQNNLTISSTSLNASSSRSHAIFTIKLVKREKRHLEAVTLSSFSLCDLAGSERQKKAKNVAMHNIKESQNINTSHLVLNRCFKILRDNQTRTRDDKQVVPFRDSKLTQLFQKALLGNELLAIIVNISQIPELIEETQVVLKASALASEIIAQKKTGPPKRRKSRFSVFCSRNKSALNKVSPQLKDIHNITTPTIEILGTTTGISEDLVEAYKLEIESLNEEIRQEKEKQLVLEMNLRCELVDKFQELLDKTVSFYEKRERESRDRRNDYGYGRRKQNFGDDSIMVEMREEIKKERDALRKQVKEQERKTLELEEENQNLKEECNMLRLKDLNSTNVHQNRSEAIKALKSGDHIKTIQLQEEEISRMKEIIQKQEALLSDAQLDFLFLEERNTKLEKLIEEYNEALEKKDEEIDDLRSDIMYTEHINETSMRMENGKENNDEEFEETKKRLGESENEMIYLNTKIEDQEKLIEKLKQQRDKFLKDPQTWHVDSDDDFIKPTSRTTIKKKKPKKKANIDMPSYSLKVEPQDGRRKLLTRSCDDLVDCSFEDDQDMTISPLRSNDSPSAPVRRLRTGKKY